MDVLTLDTGEMWSCGLLLLPARAAYMRNPKLSHIILTDSIFPDQRFLGGQYRLGKKMQSNSTYVSQRNT
eukprot:807904-Amphidinium_carterae.1